MPTKEQKRELKKLLKKYKPASKGIKNLSILNGVSGTALAAGIGIDLMVTGGLGSLAALGCTVAGFATGILTPTAALMYHTLDININKAGQSIESTIGSINILRTMENKLFKSFNTAAKKNASKQDKENFLKLDQEIKKEMNALSPFFKIIDKGCHDLGKDQYIFTFKEESTDPSQKKYIYSPEAVEQITQSLIETAKKEKTAKIQKRPKGGFGL